MGRTNELSAALKTGDREKICVAVFEMITSLGNVSAFALKSGVDRTMLYTVFNRNLSFDILLKIVRAADFKIVVVTKAGRPALQLSKAFETEELTSIIKALSDALPTRGDVSHQRLIRAAHVPRLDAVLTVLNAKGLRMAVRQRVRRQRC